MPPRCCVSCGYDNSGLPEGAPCTECGAEHYWATGGPCSSPEHIRWFLSIARANLWFLFAFLLWSVACATIAALFLMYDFVVRGYGPVVHVDWMRIAENTGGIVSVVSLLVFCIGVWTLAKREPGRQPRENVCWILRTLSAVLFFAGAWVVGAEHSALFTSWHAMLGLYHALHPVPTIAANFCALALLLIGGRRVHHALRRFAPAERVRIVRSEAAACALTMIALIAFAESSSFFPRNHSGLNEYRVIALGYAGAAMTSLLFGAVAWRTRRLFRPFV